MTGTQKALENARMTGELIKNKGNQAFKKEDYEAACSLLGNWAKAEEDASAVLDHLGVNAQDKQKALYRRCQARREQNRFEDAHADVEAFLLAGGKPEDAKALEENLKRGPSPILRPLIGPLARHLTAMRLYEQEAKWKAYKIKEMDANNRSMGAFANRDLRRGDQILAEKPLFRVFEHQSAADVIKRLSYNTIEQFLSLRNSYSDKSNPNNLDHLTGIFMTNAFYAENLCLEASRFNHSCRPNARYSWHAQDGCERIYALRDIAKGEEIFVTYLSGMNNYGKTRAERQARLSAFTCACSLCSADDETVAASDTRRRKLSALWEGLTKYSPKSQAEMVLRDAIKGIRLMQEEGYFADADDFATDAVGICQVHSDWESAKYWAAFMYETRVAEFGEDHKETLMAKEMMESPSDKKWHGQSGLFKGGKNFSKLRL